MLWGLEGEDPETIDTRLGPLRIAEIAESARIRLNGTHQIGIHLDNDVILHRRQRLPYHPNGMTFTAFDADGTVLLESTYYSIGGGFIVAADAEGHPVVVPDPTAVPYDFRTGAELMAHCAATGLRISDVMLANECARRSETDVRTGLLRIWQVMAECVRNGCGSGGVLPGGLKVRRRAGELYARLTRRGRRRPVAGRRDHRSDRGARLGHPVGAGRQRGERLRWTGRHRPDQRRRRHHPCGPALRRTVRARRG